jgi:hypothetical protein
LIETQLVPIQASLEHRDGSVENGDVGIVYDGIIEQLFEIYVIQLEYNLTEEIPMHCSFCNKDMPKDHVVACANCNGQAHIDGDKTTCACCGKVASYKATKPEPKPA